MKTSYPRLKKAKLKNGAELRVIHGGSRILLNDFHGSCQETAEFMPDMAGYAIVTWDFRGRACRSWAIHDRSPIQRSLLPSYVKDILLKEITETQTLENLEGTEE